MQFWNELEGRSINGRFPLLRLIRSEGRSAWFETETGDPLGSRATISLIEALTDADEVAARLQTAQSLNHANLVSITQVGQVELDDTLFVYAVMAHIEQSLSDVLQSQSLTPGEGREVAEALVAALTVIHEKGLSHGRVEAASVLATEHAVKLRSDCLQMGPGGQADDVAGIGATLFHAFTQREALTITDAQINRIPSPFAEIVRNSFGRRWTLAQVANALKPAQPVAAPHMPVMTPAMEAPVAAPVVVPPPAEVPVASLEPLPPRTETFDPEPEQPAGARQTPWGLYGGLAVLGLAVVGWLLWGWLLPKPNPAPVPQAAAAAPAVVVRPAPAKLSPAPTAAVANGGPVWRVVAYTYNYEKPAEEMMERIKKRHPDLKPAVFRLSGNQGDYLISLGGAMNHEEAVKMLHMALHMGLPNDTFLRKFRE